MKARMHFDTLTYANKLKAAGMDPKLAEVQALALVEAMEDGVATKIDLTEVKTVLSAEIAGVRSELSAEIAGVRNELSAEIAGVRSELSAEIAGVRSELKSEFKEGLTTLKSELVKWMVSLFITNLTLVGAFIALAQFLNHSH